MTNDRVFVDYLLELLTPLDGITAKRMFGGYGIFRQGLMFALVADSTLYFKVDDGNRSTFTTRGLEPFLYTKGGKQVQMSYYRAPEEVLDTPEEMCAWAENAYQAALRSQKS